MLTCPKMGANEDEDYKLALKLQREEQEAYRREKERIAAASSRVPQNRHVQDELSSEVEAYMRLEPPSREAPKPKRRDERSNEAFREDESTTGHRPQGQPIYEMLQRSPS